MSDGSVKAAVANYLNGWQNQSIEERKSFIRIRVTQYAAAFIFAGGFLVTLGLVVTGHGSEAKDLFLAILPAASGIVYFWFGNRKATVDVDGPRTRPADDRQHGGNEKDQKDE